MQIFDLNLESWFFQTPIFRDIGPRETLTRNQIILSKGGNPLPIAEMSESTEPWDKWVRSDHYSIVNKREKFDEFRNHPTVDTLRETADTWWATVTRWSIDHYVEEVVLGKGHTPVQIRDMIKEVIEGDRSITDAEIPGMGIATLTEVLEIIDPEQYVALNAKSREGMDALGYDVPDGQPTDEEYYAFVDDVKEAVEKYDLRERLSALDEIGDISDESDVDVAEAAFNLHAEDKFSFDLTEIRESERQTRVVDVELPRGLYEKVGNVVQGNLLYTDEEDYIKTKLREAVQADE